MVAFDLPRLGDVRGLRGVHLQCHIGTDTLSLARLGATMTGLDFSEASITQARALAGLERQVQAEGLGDEEVMLTLGSQYAFDLICQGLIRRGDEVACDAPCYPDTWCTALRRGASVLPLPVDEEGLDPDHLEALLAGKLG